MELRVFLSKYPFRETKTISLLFNAEYFFPEGVIKKPSLYLDEILPDLNADKFFEFSIFEYFIISDLKFFI